MTQMKRVFHFSCSLSKYAPEKLERLYQFLKLREPSLERYARCCRSAPDEGLLLINNCPGCDLIFSKKYDGVATKSVWEELADSDFPFPDYGGMRMAVHDSCDVRGKDEVYDAVRKILTRMNIVVVDPIKCRAGSVCCGASMYDKMTEAQWLAFVEKRAKDFPIDDVAVYCVSCLKYIGKVGKKPHHLIDLLFK